MMPAAMPGHWLYRFFPQVWQDEGTRTWATSEMYNQLVQAGFHVKLARHNYHQPIAAGVAHQLARQRKAIPQLAALLDETYDSSLAMLRAETERMGKEKPIGSEFCLIEVTAVRG